MMRTLRRILAIARKELLVLMGTRQSRFMVLIPPVIQIFIFAWAATMEVKNVDVVVINEDSGYWSQEVISRLRGSPTFRHITFEDDFKKAEEAINRQDVLVVMHFQNDFSAKVERGVPAEVQLLLDGRRSNTAQILTQYVQQIVQGLATATPAFVQAKPSRVEIITGLTVARERELGTFDQMLVSPASPVEIACGKLIPGCVVGLVHGTIFFFSIIGFFKVPFVGSVAVLYVTMLLFSLSVSSIGLMVSSFASTQQHAFLGSGAVPQGYHHECGTGQQRADRRDHGGIHAVRDLDVYAQGIGPDTLRIDSGMAIKKRACRARRCRGPAKGVREARRR